MTERLKVCAYRISVFIVLGFALAGLSHAQLCPSNQVCALTWQQDTNTDVTTGYSYRTGENLLEGTITPTTISQANFNFGQLCSVALDGQVYSQPLVVANVTIGAYTGPVVYVVTENDSVYAIQGTPPTSGTICHVLKGPVSLLNGNFSGQPTMSAVDWGLARPSPPRHNL